MFYFNGIAQVLDVGVFRANSISRIDFSYHNGSYIIQGDTTYCGAILPNEYVSLRKTSNGKVELKHGVKLLGRFDTIQLKPTGTGFALRLNPKAPVLKQRRYMDGFKIYASSKDLVIVNQVKMDNYLAGVVESEGGGGKHIEYYKAQAVISRTYALKHLHKHKEEGFMLCDQVHCQAYYNMLRFTPTIRQAVKETRGEYIIDTVTGQLIEGYFHANCGGQTSHASYVWNKDISYLQPFKDTFCIHTPQATWQKKILKKEWRDFLVNNYHYPIEDSVYASLIYTFEQEDRKAFFISPHLGIPLRDLRYHFKLKSTFFSCYPDGAYVVLNGRGFGHGIGLCQEGAMGMANKGYTYYQILSHYFDGIQLVNRIHELFFNQEKKIGF